MAFLIASKDSLGSFGDTRLWKILSLNSKTKSSAVYPETLLKMKVRVWGAEIEALAVDT